MTCTLDNNKFAVSVADALLFDTSCAGEQLILNAKTLINSSLTQAIQSNTVYGGKGSQSIFEFDYQKEITVTLEDSVFSPTYLATQAGTKMVEEVGQVYRNETVKLDGTGVGTLEGTPVGNVQVGLEDGTYMVALATGSTVTLPTMANKEVVVVYTEEISAKTITIDAKSFPKTLKLVLLIDIFDANGKVEEMQITIPRFKPDGSMELSLTHDGVATSSLSGKALSNCGEYAKIKFIPVERQAEVCTLTGLLVTPTAIELDSTVGGDSEQLTARPVFSDGSAGTPYVSTALSFVSSDDTVAKVSTSGLVTIDATATTGETATITVTKTGTTPPIEGKVTIKIK